MHLKSKIFRGIRRVVPAPYVRPFKKLYVHGSNWLRYGDWNFLHAISIEITEHCNRRCYYCPVSVNPKPVNEITAAVWSRAVDRLVELDWNNVVDFTFYNEPLLCKNLEHYVADLVRRLPKCIPQIITNGDALTEKRVQSLINSGVQNFLITHHPPYTGKWLNNVDKLCNLFPTFISYKSIEDTGLFNRGGLVKPKYQEDLQKNGCFAATNGLVIDIHGDYLYCCCDYNREYVMGNVFKDSILSVRNHPHWTSARKGAEQSLPLLDICKKCFTQVSPPPPSGNTPKDI